MRIFLIGFMGAGKSYLGRELANNLGFAFIDLDEVVEAKVDMAIPAIFDQLGEPQFRQLEADALRSLAEKSEIVVATGGGTPCFLQNMDWMNENGITVYLHAPATLLAARLRPEKATRPLLQDTSDGELETLIAEKIAERAIFYENCHLQFEVPPHGMDGLDVLASYLKRFFSKK